MRGRWPDGLEFIDKCEAAVETKERLKSILCTMFHQRRVLEVCAQHDIGETRFEQLRQAGIQGALDAMTPRPAGRPSRTAKGEQAERIRALEQEVRELKQALREAEVCAEIALVLQPARSGADVDNPTNDVEKKMRQPQVKIRKPR